VDLRVGSIAPRLISRAPGRARVALAAAEMLLLGGDRVAISVEVGPGCELFLEEVGATVALRADRGRSEWEVNIGLAAGATLVWAGEPFVLAAGCDVLRSTAVAMAADSRLLLRETLVLGRDGEIGGRGQVDFAASDSLGPILRERLVLAGSDPAPGLLGGNRVQDSIVALGFRPPAQPGDLVLSEPGSVRRFLGRDTHMSDLGKTWGSWVRAAVA
jgi:urease accessory protein